MAGSPSSAETGLGRTPSEIYPGHGRRFDQPEYGEHPGGPLKPLAQEQNDEHQRGSHMPVEAKICGIKDSSALDAAVTGGARFVGLVFYPRSPRYVSPEAAAALAARAPKRITKVGLTIDADDDTIGKILNQVPLDMLQCHGKEEPERIEQLKMRFGLPVMKAVGIAAEEDVARAGRYEDCADWLLFDAKPPETLPNALPGGNALVFDWNLIAGSDWSKPWMLSGGLNAGNVADAIKVTGARAVDVSSGVEDSPGVKSPERVSAFLNAVHQL